MFSLSIHPFPSLRFPTAFDSPTRLQEYTTVSYVVLCSRPVIYASLASLTENIPSFIYFIWSRFHFLTNLQQIYKSFPSLCSRPFVFIYAALAALIKKKTFEQNSTSAICGCNLHDIWMRECGCSVDEYFLSVGDRRISLLLRETTFIT